MLKERPGEDLLAATDRIGSKQLAQSISELEIADDVRVVNCSTERSPSMKKGNQSFDDDSELRSMCPIGEDTSTESRHAQCKVTSRSSSEGMTTEDESLIAVCPVRDSMEDQVELQVEEGILNDPGECVLENSPDLTVPVNHGMTLPSPTHLAELPALVLTEVETMNGCLNEMEECLRGSREIDFDLLSPLVNKMLAAVKRAEESTDAVKIAYPKDSIVIDIKDLLLSTERLLNSVKNAGTDT